MKSPYLIDILLKDLSDEELAEIEKQAEYMANSYQTSTGERVKKSVIDSRIKDAKAEKLEQFRDEHGYYFCEDCKTSQGRIDCSHEISVKEAQETGRSELAWDVQNIKLRCRACHQKHDKLC